MSIDVGTKPRAEEAAGGGAAGRVRQNLLSFRTRRGYPPQLLALAAVATGAVLLPVGFLIWQATQAGWAKISDLVFRELTWTLLVNTVELAAIVTVCSALIAVSAAWLIERTDVPLRRVWRVLVVLPLAIPDFVVGYTWSSLTPAVHGLFGASLVMTMGLYPLAYLPVAAALRRADSSLYEVARSLGCSRTRAFRRAILPQIRAGLLGGSMIVTLALLAEYGAFEILRFQTFTTEIFTQFKLGFNVAAASALSLVLVLLSLLVLGGELTATRRGARRAGGVRVTVPRRYRLGWGKLPALAGFGVLAGTGVGVPVSTLIYWLTQPANTTLPPIPLTGAVLHTLGYSAAAAVLSTVVAFPVALLVIRHPGRLSMLLERAGYLVQGLPGLVIALSLVFFATRAAYSLYQTPQLLVAAYAVMFFPLALVCLRAGLSQVPRRLTDTARSLGCSPAKALLRVTLPLAAPGIAASLAMVFLSAVTELTATLVLVPNGVNTLATAFWSYESDVSYAAASRYAALIVVLAVIPGIFLARWLDPARESSSRASRTGGSS